MVYQLIPPRKYNDTVFSGVTKCSLVKKSVSFTLKMGAVGYTEARVNFYQTARRGIPEDSKYPKFHNTCFTDSATSYC